MDERVVLSVEDSDADFYVIEMALKQANIAIQVCRVHDGEEAISFLEWSGSFDGAPRPHMILLNLHMPRKDGFEVLEYLRAHDDFRSIPAVTFTTLVDQHDRTRAQALEVKQSVTKDHNLSGLHDGLASVCTRYVSRPQERTSRDGQAGVFSAEA